MADLKNPNVIVLKGFLFLLLGLLSGGLLLFSYPEFSVLLLLGITVWAFCRFYYFAFYVIGNYVDHEYKFAGLYSFFCYWLANRDTKLKPKESEEVL